MSKTLFDHINAVYQNQSLDYYDTLDDGDKKSYSTYMVNRFVSMNPAYVEVVNEIQKYPVENRESYLFYSQILPKGRQFNKYVKATKDVIYEKWIIDLVSTYFQVSRKEAEVYLSIFYMTAEGKLELKEIVEMYGTDPKLIKRLKLG